MNLRSIILTLLPLNSWAHSHPHRWIPGDGGWKKIRIFCNVRFVCRHQRDLSPLSFDNKIYGLVKKSLYLNYWESYDNCIDFMAAILKFLFQKNLFRMTVLHWPRCCYRVLSKQNQKRNKLLLTKTSLPPWLQENIDFTENNIKNHTLHPSIRGGRDRETSFAP